MQHMGVKWVHRDPVAKSQRLTDEAGNVVAVVELDPWGGETERSENPRYHPYVYGEYERDGNWSDQAQRRVYHGWYSRFYQPDPWDGSYDLTDPQSFNRYAYVQNDPVNFVDPSGLMMEGGVSCYIDGVESDCGLALRMVEAGAAVIGPEQTTRWNPDANLGQGGWEFFRALADGRVGWFNIQGVSITVSAVLSHAEMGAWFAGSHTYVNVFTNISSLQKAGGSSPFTSDDSDVRAVSGALSVAGIGASIGEYSNVNPSGTMWRGLTKEEAKWYRMSWGGNQYVSRSAAVARANAYRLLGRSAFALGAGISAYQGVQALRHGEYGKAGKSGLDIIMGGVGVIGGPIGAGVSGGYFIIATIGWGNVRRSLVTPLPQGTGFTRAKIGTIPP
ncbi:RHS repeat protein [Pyrinomonas methylaliphatogenes]|uniref:RHS repeat protein n=1 Tax=Pyrinomonas methylaliphatogenes TaxID=454194 RepID=UPI001F450384|nr:RHS repeat-associated core domain-containing protein [Pyrinomonas methylaliphatogenes]